MKRASFFASLLVFLVAFTLTTVALAGERGVCPECGKEVQEINEFSIVYKDGKEVSFGCPHCGLKAVNAAGDVKEAKATDFLRKKKIDAKTAWYLKGSEVGTCCAPYWLSFATRDEAEKFSKGFGGKVMSYEEALKDPDARP